MAETDLGLVHTCSLNLLKFSYHSPLVANNSFNSAFFMFFSPTSAAIVGILESRDSVTHSSGVSYVLKGFLIHKNRYAGGTGVGLCYKLSCVSVLAGIFVIPFQAFQHLSVQVHEVGSAGEKFLGKLYNLREFVSSKTTTA
eukprot:snap_masked-scaffold_12-processed-gene-4.15-mRNA-1 protein AED:1.00 eAED:1.00 QI:0/0/0/0/1/1/4/0/140